jgi:hypothetical protein
MQIAFRESVQESSDSWERERRTLLERRISELGLSIRGTLVERLVAALYQELDAKGLAFRPVVYLSDQWGCPEGTPVIGVPFYLADPRLMRLEEEIVVEVEGESDTMRYLRHEAGHAFNYAYRLYDRPDWRRIFGPYSRPYRERYHVDPFSRAHVRHILGWYAQKHPDEDFAETFAVWLTPSIDWRAEYKGWPALAKLEYVDEIAREIGRSAAPEVIPGPDDLPVEAMDYTLADHYADVDQALPVSDERHFDGDLRTVFADATEAPAGESAAMFLRRHSREIVRRIAYWTGEPSTAVRRLIDLLIMRSDAMQLRVRGLEASTLIELTAFAAAVMMNYRFTNTLDGARRSGGE